jgi:hypothetical protein
VNGPKKIGGLPQILDRQLEEEGLARLAFFPFLADGIVVEVGVLNREVEDRGIRCKSCDREFLDIMA